MVKTRFWIPKPVNGLARVMETLNAVAPHLLTLLLVRTRHNRGVDSTQGAVIA
jgi:hypothetical protein